MHLFEACDSLRKVKQPGGRFYLFLLAAFGYLKDLALLPHIAVGSADGILIYLGI